MQKHVPKKLGLSNISTIWIMNFNFGLWILVHGFCIMNFDFQFRISDLDIEFLFCMFIQFLFVKVMISNNTRNLLNFNEDPNPNRQTEILSSTTNTWTSIKKIFFSTDYNTFFFKYVLCMWCKSKNHCRKLQSCIPYNSEKSRTDLFLEDLKYFMIFWIRYDNFAHRKITDTIWSKIWDAFFPWNFPDRGSAISSASKTFFYFNVMLR